MKLYKYLILDIKKPYTSTDLSKVLNHAGEQGFEYTGKEPAIKFDRLLFKRETEGARVTIYPPGSPQNSDYLERNLIYHLAKAGRWEDIEKLLLVDFFKNKAKEALDQRDEQAAKEDVSEGNGETDE